jgi:hypothetical protein
VRQIKNFSRGFINKKMGYDVMAQPQMDRAKTR